MPQSTTHVAMPIIILEEIQRLDNKTSKPLYSFLENVENATDTHPLPTFSLPSSLPPLHFFLPLLLPSQTRTNPAPAKTETKAKPTDRHPTTSGTTSAFAAAADAVPLPPPFPPDTVAVPAAPACPSKPWQVLLALCAVCVCARPLKSQAVEALFCEL